MVEAIVDLNPKQVVLVHGERDQRHNLAVALRKEGLNVAEFNPQIPSGFFESRRRDLGENLTTLLIPHRNFEDGSCPILCLAIHPVGRRCIS